MPASENVSEKWTDAHERAATLLAIHDYTDQHVADDVGVDVRTLYRWKQRTDFAERIRELTRELCAGVRDLGIAVKERRVKELNEHHARIKRGINSRAARYAADPDAPHEAHTGLWVQTERRVGPVTTLEWAFDAGMSRELRTTEEQMAKELGEYSEGRHHSGELAMKHGGKVEIEHSVSDELAAEHSRVIDAWMMEIQAKIDEAEEAGDTGEERSDGA